MAGRGGRGRGKGSFAQIAGNLGINRSELSQSFEGPSSTYQPLDIKPLNIEINNEMREILAVKKKIRERVTKLPYFINFDKNANQSYDVQRYTDKYKIKPQSIYEYANERFDWNYFPKELRPKLSKLSSRAKPKIDNINIDEKLKKLENFEEKLKGDEVEVNDEIKGDGGSSRETKKADGEEGEEDEVAMDSEDDEEENDYAQNYFDNGEGFLEEDNDSDEGPVY